MSISMLVTGVKALIVLLGMFLGQALMKTFMLTAGPHMLSHRVGISAIAIAATIIKAIVTAPTLRERRHGHAGHTNRAKGQKKFSHRPSSTLDCETLVLRTRDHPVSDRKLERPHLNRF